jgi:NADH:ubiquinone oxidoreductase subunit 5 (subunit L)/multisubunit Na+/H+ antiporter MnhA subunit
MPYIKVGGTMAGSPEKPTLAFENKEAQRYFDRARATAVELAKLILTLATGSIGGLALAAMHPPTGGFTHYQQRLFISALIILVLALAFSLGGIAADAASDGSLGMSKYKNERHNTDHWHKKHDRSRDRRKYLLTFAAVCLAVGIICAGSLIFTFVRTPASLVSAPASHCHKLSSPTH